jgi:hypothetical protein
MHPGSRTDDGWQSCQQRSQCLQLLAWYLLRLNRGGAVPAVSDIMMDFALKLRTIVIYIYIYITLQVIEESYEP